MVSSALAVPPRHTVHRRLRAPARWRTLTMVLASPAALLGAQPAASPPPDTTEWRPSVVDARETPAAARAIINETLSPYCPGLILAACPSPQADSLRKAIVLRVGNGESRDSIEASLYRTYGDDIRAAPGTAGLGLVAWLTPGLLLLVGGAGITIWLRGARTTRHTAPTPASRAATADPAADLSARAAAVGASPAELARLDALLRHDDR